MPSPGDLRAILEARFEIENADPQDQPTLQHRYEVLIDTVLQGTACSRITFLEAIRTRYQTYRRERYKAEKRRQS